MVTASTVVGRYLAANEYLKQKRHPVYKKAVEAAKEFSRLAKEAKAAEKKGESLEPFFNQMLDGYFKVKRELVAYYQTRKDLRTPDKSVRDFEHQNMWRLDADDSYDKRTLYADPLEQFAKEFGFYVAHSVFYYTLPVMDPAWGPM